MKKQQRSVTYLYYPKEVHDYRRDENWVSFFAVAERFLHQSLGGRFEPVGNDLDEVAFEIKAGGDLIPEITKAKNKKPVESPVNKL